MSNQRTTIRMTFCEAWNKHKFNAALSPLEQQLIQIILQHPEYHSLLENTEQALSVEYHLSENPFLHMGMHLTILEQITTDRPAGIRQLYQTLCQQKGNVLEAEHEMMKIILDNLWEAQTTGAPVSDEIYLMRLRKLLKGEEIHT